jgi:hypothetical protein
VSGELAGRLGSVGLSSDEQEIRTADTTNAVTIEPKRMPYPHGWGSAMAIDFDEDAAHYSTK